MTDIDKITDHDIGAAVAMDDSDSACAMLRAIAGIADGRVAGIVFSDIDFDWRAATTKQREAMIRRWLATERGYGEP
jgi:hypothetical protein